MKSGKRGTGDEERKEFFLAGVARCAFSGFSEKST